MIGLSTKHSPITKININIFGNFLFLNNIIANAINAKINAIPIVIPIHLIKPVETWINTSALDELLLEFPSSTAFSLLLILIVALFVVVPTLSPVIRFPSINVSSLLSPAGITSVANAFEYNFPSLVYQSLFNSE